MQLISQIFFLLADLVSRFLKEYHIKLNIYKFSVVSYTFIVALQILTFAII